MNTPALQRAVFLLLLAGSTLAFLWVLTPFFGAVFWAIALAMLFNPLFQRLRRRLGGRANLAALLTLLIALVIVILPMIMVAGLLVDDMTSIVQRMRAGDINLRTYFNQIVAALPGWATAWLERLGFLNLESVIDRISSGLLQGGQLVATRALAIGQNTFQFLVQFVVMLYLLFFLLRDGMPLARLLRTSAPLAPGHTRYLLQKFATVVRATVKGNVVVAVVQGALGGLALWALGIGGAVWQGVALIVWGVVVIGLSDNVLRPILVGKDTKLPDYVVLITTLGGMSLFGINGFVIGPTIAAMFMACWALFQSGDEIPPDDDEDEDDEDGLNDGAGRRVVHAAPMTVPGPIAPPPAVAPAAEPPPRDTGPDTVPLDRPADERPA